MIYSVDCAVARTLSVVQIPAADLSQCVLVICKLNYLTSWETAIAVAVKDYHCTAVLNEFYKLRVINFRAHNTHTDAVARFRVRLTDFNLFQSFFKNIQNKRFGADIACQNQQCLLIAGNGRIVKLSEIADFSKNAAYFIVFGNRSSDRSVGNINSVVFMHGFQDFP